MAVCSLPIRPDSITPLRCANWRDQGTACESTGAIPCQKCKLILYCSPACKNGHGDVHMLDCEHGVASSTWIPRWFAENREPTFLKDGSSTYPLSRNLARAAHSWGNRPATDHLKVEANEGATTQRHVKILSVETDIRHGVRTVIKLPEGFSAKVTLTYTNGSMPMFARNVIVAMLAYFVPDKSAAVDCMIHLWYSAYLKPCHVQLLGQYILPCIADAASRASSYSAGEATCTQTLVENGRGVTITLAADQWELLLQYFQFAPEDDTTEPHSVITRSEITANDAFEDERDLILLRNPPHRRVAIMKFWEDGVLQPFGQDCSEFTIPNPTLFRDGNWVLEELADPFDGWDFVEVMSGAEYMPESDMYGRLFCHLQELFSDFVKKANDHAVVFEMQHEAPENAHLHLEHASFSRIDVTAVTEHPELGLEKIYENLGSLLELPENNPHATMIAMYTRVIAEELLEHEDLSPQMAQRDAVGRLLDLDTDAMDELNSGDMVRCHDALPLVLDLDKAFNRWKDTSGLISHLRDNGLQIKANNTVVKEWPTRIDLMSVDTLEGLKRSFSLAMASTHGGYERLVEIQRVTKKTRDDSNN